MEDRALKADAWVDLERANSLGGKEFQAVQRLRNNEVVEVSVGAFTDIENRAGKFRGEEFFGIWRLITPDHLAFLEEGAEGACSTKDGCGANRAAKGRNMAVNTKARRPDYSGTSSGEWSDPSLQAFMQGLRKHTDIDVSDLGDNPDVGDLPAAAKAWIASKSLLGNADANNLRDLRFFPVVDPNNDELYENALDAVISGRGSQAEISDDARESARNMAYTLLREEFDRDVSREGETKGLVGLLSELLGKNRKETEKEILTLGGKAMNREQKITALISSESTKFTENDRQLLESFEDETLDKLQPLEQGGEGGEGGDSRAASGSEGDEGKPAGDDDQGQAPRTAEGYIAQAPEELQPALREAKRVADEKRDNLISRITGATSDFTKEELGQKDLSELERLAKLAVGPDYSGQGDAHIDRSAEDRAAPAPPSLSEKLQGQQG